MLLLLLACVGKPTPSTADDPTVYVGGSGTGDSASTDTAPDDTGAPTDTGDDSVPDDSVPDDTAPDDSSPGTAWPPLACDTAAGTAAPTVGVDTGACPEDAGLAAGLAEIPASDDASCPWTAPVDTGSVASGCPTLADPEGSPVADSGCIVQRKFYDGVHSYDQTFDTLGRIVASVSDDFASNYYYDTYGNLVQIDVASAWGLRQYLYAYTYDADGHVLSMVAYEYGSVTSEITYSYDEAGRLATACGDRPYTESYTWTEDGRLASYGFDGADADTTDGGGWFTYVVEYSYDAEGRMDAEYVNWIYNSWGTREDMAWSWTYDADGNPTHRYVSSDCGEWVLDETWTYSHAADCSATVTRSDAYSPTTYQYDADGRLVGVDYTSFSYSYAYEAVDCPC